MKHRDGLTWLTALPIAHRGLHDKAAGRPENSMAAFRAAMEGNYAIECDLQPSADGLPMVFHDDLLERMTGSAGNIRDRSAQDLRDLRLAGTPEPIPTLADLLAETAGKVPLILELKSQPGRDDGFAQAVTGLLSDYAGPVAVMSFDPLALREIRRLAPHLPRGLVAGRFVSNEEHSVPVRYRFAYRHLLAACVVLPHFIAYDVSGLPASAPLMVRHAFGLPLLTWTVKTRDERDVASRWADQMIFEGFDPNQIRRGA